MKTIAATEQEIGELHLQVDDVLFNEGGDRDKLGRGWVWQGQIPECIHQNHVFRARLTQCGIVPKFVSFYGNSIGQRYFIDEGKQTTNLASINLTKLGALPVPVPPLTEQQRIVAEVERRLSAVEKLEAEVEAGLRRAERLRQAILKRAFAGRLVPQDPNDEPAAALLERIRVERDGAVSTKAKPGRRNSRAVRSETQPALL
jgi:type I restriction enzyme S subunit